MIRARLHNSARRRAQEKMSEEFNADPVKYSTSKAKDFHSYDALSAPKTDTPWYQPPIIAVSMITFLLYFTILREESDWDKDISVSLYDRIPGLEESQLRQSIQYAASEGKDITEMQARLKAIIAEKKSASN